MGRDSYRIAMSVRQRIDQLISDSIDDLEGDLPESSEPHNQMAPTVVTVQIQEFMTQVQELTTQVATLTTIIKRLREE